MNGPERGIDFAGIRADNPIAETVGRYLELKRQGGEYKGRCPFHNDSNPSFAVVPAKGKAFCNACQWHGDVIDFVAAFENIDVAEAAKRLSGGQLPNERPSLPELPPDEADDWKPIVPAPEHAGQYDPARTYNPRRGREVNWKRAITRCDVYRSAEGQVLGYVVRMDIDGAKLTPTVVWARHRDGREAWISGRFPNPRPLQGLDDLAKRPTAAVLVVSGEKCREAGARALPGFVVVTWAGGDGNVLKADWRPIYGRRVTIWPDADASGEEAAHKLAEALEGYAVETRLVVPTDVPKGWDVADAVADGMDYGAIIAWVKPRIAIWNPADPEPEPPLRAPPLPDLDPDYIPPEEDPDPGYEEVPRETLPVETILTGTLPRIDAKLDATVADPNADHLPEMYSEDNVALRFSQIFADDLRFVAAWGKWMRWRDQRWVQEDTLEVFDLARKVCRSVVDYSRRDGTITDKQKPAIAKHYGGSTAVSSVERFAKADRRHAATTTQWDSDIWLLNTPAGVVDLRTGLIQPGQRTAYMTKMTRVAPGGACPTWHKFLATATGGDTELIQFLQRMCGYTLTGSVRDHALFFVYGTGGNGKGTFLNTFQWLIGDYARVAGMDVFTEKKHDAHPTELARLMGARLVTAQETEEGKRWAEARIKALTGGDPITARFMRQDDFEFLPQFKLVIAGNHKPGLRNVDEAIKRRLHLIPFTATIAPADRDPALGEKLQAEAGGILQWAIEGCLQWQQQGLRAPAAVIAATAEYLEHEDQFANWIAECCELSPAFSAASKSLYASYKAWADRSGEYAIPQRRWKQQMETRGFEDTRVKTGMMIRGIRVNLDSSFESTRPGYDPYL